MDTANQFKIKWQCKPFSELHPVELYKIMQLRNAVFVVEQNCVFQDADDKDEAAWHLCCWQNDILVAYSRLLPNGIDYPEISIGRVVTKNDHRKNGFGKILLQKAIENSFMVFGRQNIKIGAQLYLKRFYESFGFVQVSDIYLEDGIEHIKMLLSVE